MDLDKDIETTPQSARHPSTTHGHSESSLLPFSHTRRDPVPAEKDRRLNGNNDGPPKDNERCPRDDTLLLDSAWYEFSITVTSRDPIDCTKGEWNRVRKFMEAELETIDLYQRFRITELNPKICKDPPENQTPTTRRGLGVVLKDGTDDQWGTNNKVSYTDNRTGKKHTMVLLTEEEEAAVMAQLRVNGNNTAVPLEGRLPDPHGQLNSSAGIGAATATATSPTQRDLVAVPDPLNLLEFIFHLFYKGGGHCRFCRPDDDDGSGVWRGERMLAGQHDSAESWMDRHSPAMDSLTGDQHGDHTDIFLPISDPLLFQPYTNDMNRTTAESTMGTATGESMEAAIVQRPARRLSCGGCMKIDFSVDGQSKKMKGTPFLDPAEYWDSHGVRIRVHPAAHGGYAPNQKARLYNTAYSPKNENDGDFDLGSPNEKCPGEGGPGVGAGGEPTLPNGEPNAGANCQPEGRVLVIQESKALKKANSSPHGGLIVFTFRYPVLLKTVRLMNMDTYGKGKLLVYTKSGGVHVHTAMGFGDNSVETIDMYLEKVTRFVVKLYGGGAVSSFDFCHDCGESDKALKRDIDNYYPSVASRSRENQNSRATLESIQKRVAESIGNTLQYRLQNHFTPKPNHCLYRTNPGVDFQFFVSTSARARSCTADANTGP